MNIARAKRHYDISRLNKIKCGRKQLVFRRSKMHLSVSALFQRTVQRFTRNAGKRIFTRWIDFAQNHDICIVKCREKLVKQVPRARIAMRLKQSDYAATTLLPHSFASCTQGRADFFRVMSIVVDDQHPSGLSFHLKPSLDAGEITQRLLYLRERDAEFPRHRSHR